MSEVARLISSDEELVLDACDGKRTIAKAADVFSYIDSDFKNWDTDEPGRATPEMLVAVYEIAEDAHFDEMFTSINSDVSKLVLEQDQILNFVKKHGSRLRKDGCAMFFLFRAAGRLFVADVGVGSGGRLVVFVRRFEHDVVWFANCQLRLVVPQL